MLVILLCLGSWLEVDDKEGVLDLREMEASGGGGELGGSWACGTVEGLGRDAEG